MSGVVGSDVGVELSVGRTWLQLMCCAPSRPSPRFARADKGVGIGSEVAVGIGSGVESGVR